MEHPVREIAGVITSLTTGSPQEQQDTLNTYFVDDASFYHPLCRVPPFKKGTIPLARGVDSRWILLSIYRWYRTLSPQIDISIDSAVFDQRSGQLFVSIRQVFALWFVPFYKAPVRLVTVLQLRQRTSWDSDETIAKSTLTEGREPAALSGPGQERAKYYIESQEDLYQANDCIQFVMPGLGPFLWCIWQLMATGMCVVGSLVLLPLYLVMNKDAAKKSA